MKKWYLLFIVFVIFETTHAQLVLNSGLTPTQLANAIAGQGISVFNATFIGDPSMAGMFTATGTNLGINSGIILATGTDTVAIGPNISGSAGNDMGLPGDSILDTLSHSTTHDACILEFDFIPQSSSVSFRYVFASEEYPEYVCSNFNDVFAFFISGPGIVGSQNMALIPTTTTPVAINTVNIGTPGTNGSSTNPVCDTNYAAYYVDNQTPLAGQTIEFDGFTVPLTATANVHPCNTYHLRIMIADAGDGVFDSGVFLEEGSLFSNPVVDAGQDQTICSGNTTSLGVPPVTGYSYNWFPQPGTPSNLLTVTNISNPGTITLTNTTSAPITYSFVMVANSGSCLFSDSVNIVVNPSPAVTFTLSQNQVCIGTPITINYTGTIASNYNWNFGSATVISGSGSGPYQIVYSSAIHDSITLVSTNPGCSGSYGLGLTVDPTPDASFSLQPDACPNEDVTINFTGTVLANAVYTWDFGGGSVTSGSNGGPYSVNWNSTGPQTVTLTVTLNGCTSPLATSQINIGQIPAPNAGTDAAVCPNNNVSLGDAGQAGFIYQWSPNTWLDNPSISNPTASVVNTGTVPITMNYVVTVSSPGGCHATDSVTVIANPGIDVDFISTGSYCLSDNRIDFAVSGNYPAGSAFSWDFGANAAPAVSFNASEPGVKFNSIGVQTIMLNASAGSCPMAPVNHTVEIFADPVADFSTNDLQGCSPLLVRLANLSPDLTNSFSWVITGGTNSNVTDPVVTLTTPGDYDITLNASTIHGCHDTETKIKYITVFPQAISAFIPQPAIAPIESPIIYFVNTSSNADIYNWNFGDSTSGFTENPSHTYASTGIYQITLVAMNNKGCIDTSYGSVEINEGFRFFIPNSFTPDGDGVNDYFQGYGINFKTYVMMIFDRWGRKIYETNEYFKPWNGRINDVVQNDVYVYKILITDKMNEKHDFVGSVSVVK